jgi:Rne/Rng family ribonuclease
MAKEICISSTPHETRLAILEDDQLAEIYYERENEYTLAGSIYNGRVTRVLPGMQSAFVDVGLERDAFLYVTDFLELEDPEESDEVEKASASGATTPPREVRHTNGSERDGARNGRRNEGRSGQAADQRQETRPQQQPSEPAGSEFVVESDSASEHEAGGEDSEVTGGKRWRGRRRRRGGRGPAGSPGSQSGSNESGDGDVETVPVPSVASEIQAGSSERAESRSERSESGRGSRPERGFSSSRGTSEGDSFASRGSREPRVEKTETPFVLPGESLRKYGATPEAEAPKPVQEAAPRPASTFKPASLVEGPVTWDGSGLLPGESISCHRRAEANAETVSESAGFTESSTGTENIEDPEPLAERELVAEHVEATEEEFVAVPEHNLSGDAEAGEPSFEFEETEETSDTTAHPSSAESVADDEEAFAAHTPHHEEAPAEQVAHEAEAESHSQVVEAETAAHDTAEEITDGSASHHVDPSAPTGFRLFGLGGKKKQEEPAAPAPEPKAAAPSAVSSYAPGSGHIEEELIEEEEFDAPHHHHGKAEEHDLEEYEEETLPPSMRTGDLGELLQEAHLDHRIQMDFDGKNGDEEDGVDEDDEEDALAVGQPAPGTGDGTRQRSDRDARGRRGGRGGRDGRPERSGQNNRRGGPSRRSMQTSDLPIISDLLKPGQEILVQIAKEPIAKKGARITSHIALPGRFLVFMPTVTHVGVSRKIASDEERQRLKRILVSERGDASGGFIVRTAAEGASEEELRSDLRFLIHLWNEIKTRSESSKSPALIYHDLSLIERILRDQVSENFSSIWVDSQDDYERIVRFLNRFSPSLVRRVKLYTKEVPLFEHFGIQDEISKALRSKVWLKSGGSIVINQTEALVAIDINTGKYVGKSARLEDTILKTNLDAVPEIVRQIRLRDLGGIIVIDFIDMDERKNRFRVMAALEEALKSDRAPTKVLQFNDFGLVAITRKRVKQSLERTLSVPCPTCQATGMVKSPTTVCNEIYIELRKMKKHFEGADVLLRVNPETVKVLKQNNASWLVEFEELVGKNILVKSDPTLHAEQFDIQG